MSDVTPQEPRRLLIWPDTVLDLQDLLADLPTPIYIVGGAVRDAYLHRPVQDIDLTVADNAIPLARRIANHLHGDFFVLDDERDVGRALVDTPQGRLLIDVTRFRGADLLADLVDRDFTLNAIAVDIRDTARIVDPLGGQQDIDAKMLRRCSPQAISSDPIRALRAVRQSVQLGLRIEAETLQDIRANAVRLGEISPERVRDEFFKLLSLPNSASGLRIADAVGLLKVIIPEVETLHSLQLDSPYVFDGWRHTLAMVEHLSQLLASIGYTRTDATAASFSLGMVVIQLDRFRQQLNMHLNNTWPNERPHTALLTLAALLHEAGTDRASFAHRADSLRLSNAEKDRLTIILQYFNELFHLPDLSRRTIYRFWRVLDEAGVDVGLLTLADYLGTFGAELNQDDWLVIVERVRVLLEAYFEKKEEVVAPPPLLDGSQLMQALGLRPGKQVGELLELIREGQAAGEVQSVEDALNLARLHQR
jgi:tRNA nucleotidyltransferase/poly(A) polymerase